MVSIGLNMAESTSFHETHTDMSDVDSSSVTDAGRLKVVVLPDADRPLPVVELKPFTKQVWRREKSYPEFYDRLVTTDEENTIDKRLQLENETTEVTNKKEAAANAILVSKFLDRQRVYTSEVRFSDSSGPRYRTKIHPSVDFSYNCRPQKSNGLIPEFIPRRERTKTTFQEASKDESANQQYNLAKPQTSEYMTTKREMKIHGGRVTHTSGIPKFHLSYLNPLENYKKSDSWKNHKYRSKERKHLNSFSDGSPQYSEENGSQYYKSSAASSEASSILGVPVKHRGRMPMKHVVNNHLSASLGNKNQVSVSIGGIKNALDVLSESGPPTKLERQLTFEMEINMEKCRRNLQLMPPDSVSQFQTPAINPSMFYDVNRPVTLTRGEEMLKQGRKLNSRKQSCRPLRERPVHAFEVSRNLRPANALHMESDSPRTDTLEAAVYNGLFDRMSEISAASAPHQSSLYQFSRGYPLRDIEPKGGNSNHSPTTDVSTIKAESIPRDFIRIDDVKDERISPRTASIVSGNSNNITTYITEPFTLPGSHVMTMDSRVLRDRKSVESQPSSFSRAHFKPCSNVKLKEDSPTPESGRVRTLT